MFDWIRNIFYPKVETGKYTKDDIKRIKEKLKENLDKGLITPEKYQELIIYLDNYRDPDQARKEYQDEIKKLYKKEFSGFFGDITGMIKFGIIIFVLVQIFKVFRK